MKEKQEINYKIDINVLKNYIETINSTKETMIKIKEQLNKIEKEKTNKISKELNSIFTMISSIKDLLTRYPHDKNKIFTDIIKQIMQENNGMISTKMIEPLNISRQYLAIMEKNKEIEKIARGIYLAPGKFEDSYFCFQQRYKKAIFSHMNALYFYDMTEEFPYNYTVTVPQNYHVDAINKKCNVFYVADDIYEVGLTKIKTLNGNIIYAYDKERCICDIIRSKNKMDPEQVKKAIKQYLASKDKDLVKLTIYAKKMKINEKVMMFLDNYN